MRSPRGPTGEVVGVLQLERQGPSSCYDAHDVEVAGLLACWAGGLLHAARAFEACVEQARWVAVLSEAARLMHRDLTSPAALLRQLVGAAVLLAPARHVICWRWAADATLERGASLAEGGGSVQGHGTELRACALRCARRQAIARATCYLLLATCYLLLTTDY